MLRAFVAAQRCRRVVAGDTLAVGLGPRGNREVQQQEDNGRQRKRGTPPRRQHDSQVSPHAQGVIRFYEDERERETFSKTWDLQILLCTNVCQLQKQTEIIVQGSDHLFFSLMFIAGKKGRGQNGAGEPRPTHRSPERALTEAPGKAVSSTSEAAKEE